MANYFKVTLIGFDKGLTSDNLSEERAVEYAEDLISRKMNPEHIILKEFSRAGMLVNDMFFSEYIKKNEIKIDEILDGITEGLETVIGGTQLKCSAKIPHDKKEKDYYSGYINFQGEIKFFLTLERCSII